MAVIELRTDYEVGPDLYEQTLSSLIEQVSLDEDLHFVARLSQDYSKELPYHHYGHSLGVTSRALKIAEERGIHDHESLQTLLLAALWHDADYAEPLQDSDGETRHPSKEHRSADLAYQAIAFNSSRDRIVEIDGAESHPLADRVSELICGTNPSYRCDDELSEILNLADLANLYDNDSLVTLRETGLYFIEGRLLDGEEIGGQVLDEVMGRRKQLEAWLTSARDHTDELIKRKLNPTDPRVASALQNISRMTVGYVLEALSSSPKDD